jgi:hypothetical protein
MFFSESRATDGRVPFGWEMPGLLSVKHALYQTPGLLICRFPHFRGAEAQVFAALWSRVSNLPLGQERHP